MSENAITVGQSIADAPQASGSVEQPGTLPDDPQTQTLAGQPPANDNAEEETVEEAVERMIHGMSADQVLAALEEGIIPEELYEHLRIKGKYKGEEEELSLQEYRDERMRQIDYSRNMAQYKRELQEFHQSLDAFGAMVEGWKNKDPMHVTRTLEQLEHLGLPIHELTSIYAQRHTEQQALVEAVPEQLRPMFKAMLAEREEMRRTLQGLKLNGQGQPQQQREDPNAAVARDRIQRLSPAAFKREKLADNESNRKMFFGHLANIWDRNTELTQQHVNDAARAVRQEIEANLRSLGYQPGPVANDNGKPRVAPAPGARTQQPSVRRAATQAPRNPAGINGSQQGAATLDQLRERWNKP
jgi:hypothetical protein